MDELLKPKGGDTHFLLGNEAIVRGALEAGVAFATTYPGTPSSEIGNTLYGLAPKTDRYYFEFSANEKVALEVASAAAASGLRTLCFMKHVGLNVAADSLMTLAYVGVRAGMVIVTAGDPGCHSSQNEQDNRYYGRLGLLPVLEPATPQEAKDMVVEGIRLSEELELPVLLRTTTRVNHMRGLVRFGDLPEDVRRKARFEKNPRRFVTVPAVARVRRRVQLETMERAAKISDASDLNQVFGDGPLGVVASGVSFNYVIDALAELDLAGEVAVFKVGFSHPLPEGKLAEFLVARTRCLVVEELEPILEREIQALAHRRGIQVEILGKEQGLLPRAGEFAPDTVTEALARFAGRPYERPAEPELPELPSRPPNLCAGCPHRATYYAAKLVTGKDAIFSTDIGCYTLGLLPPLEMADFLICMGSSVTSAGGFSKATDQLAVAFIGDSTFYHTGIPGLVNAVHNGHDEILVVLDNSTTAMTGHQPHPGSSVDGMQHEAPPISIEAMCQAAGVTSVRTVNAFDLREVTEAFRAARQERGVRVIVSRGACIFVDRPRLEKRPVFTVDHDKCMYCGLFQDHQGCTEVLDSSIQWTRAACRIQALAPGSDPAESPLPAKKDVAPCTWACPAHLCVQSYVTLIRAGRYADAAKAVRDRIPLASVVSRVCHRPCEKACTRGRYDAPLAINALKRFAMEHEDLERTRRELAQRLAAAPDRKEKVAVVGAGPAGLAAAHELRLRGYGVEIFDAAPRAGGLLALGIPAYRLPREVLALDLDLIRSLGVTMHLNTAVGRDVTLEELRSRFHAVVWAAGAWKGARLGLEGEDAEGVVQALDFLKKVNLGEQVNVGRKVVVVGGGDAAMDAARTAVRLGAQEVIVVYRRSEREMPASRDEVEAAEKEGVSFEFLAGPVGLKVEAGRLAGLRLVRMELAEKDDSGRRRPVPVSGSEFHLDCDMLLVAIGQKPDLDALPAEVERTDKGALLADAKDGRTSLPGLFAAGDAVSGPDTVIGAIASGQRAAAGVASYLEGEAAWQPPVGVWLDEEDTVLPFLYEPEGLAGTTRQIMPELSGEARTASFEEVELGLTEEQALAEASRCLACGSCAKCRVCVDTFACPAFYVKDGLIHIDETLCVGCGVCAQLCPNNAIRPKTA